MKKTYKCSDLYTATFEDGTLMTGTLDQLYTAQNNRKMAIKPVVWLWCSDSGLYMVDYILEGAGWTLGVFDTLADAEKAVAAFNAQPAADVAAMLTETSLKRFTCEVECKALGDDGRQYNAVASNISETNAHPSICTVVSQPFIVSPQLTATIAATIPSMVSTFPFTVFILSLLSE